MKFAVTEAWRDELLLARDARFPSERVAMAAAVRKGELIRISRGAYLRRDLWRALTPDARYRARIAAVAATSSPELIFGRESAAAMWRLPWHGPWTARVHAFDPTLLAGRTTKRVIRHAAGLRALDFVVIDGLRVTPLARTVVDVAASSDRYAAVVVADAALSGRSTAGEVLPKVGHADLRRQLSSIPQRHGSARARDVLEFADGRSGSPWESVSRVSIAVAGLPAPELQKAFPKPGGGFWYVDFWWEESNLIGEFDGKAKYLEAELRGGLSAEEVLYEEKQREDALRARGHRFSRWGSGVAASPRALATLLLAAGLRP